MLQLTRLRLINWHFFADSTVCFGPTTLLAGDNGTGKSTIIDAIQYALVAQVSKIRFNSAASDRRAARTLESYCRCKIGADALDYLRGDGMSHVMLEFSDGDRVFSAGIAVEVFVDGEPREHLWVFEAGTIEDVPFADGDDLLDARRLRERLRALGATVCATKREYNNRLTNLLGVYRRTGGFNPYLEAVVRSVSFTPVSSVNHFVCNYILEDHPVDVGAMKENLENYRLAEREAVAVEAKIGRLETIVERADAVLLSLRQILRQEYLRTRLHAERAAEALRETEKHADEAQQELANTEEYHRLETDRKQLLEAHRQEMSFALAENEQHRLYERLRRDREETDRALSNERSRIDRRDLLRKQCEAMLGRPLGEQIDEEETGLTASIRDATRRSVEIDVQIGSAKAERAELRREREELLSGVLRYPDSTMQLKDALEEAGIDALIFADLLEVEDEAWHNALEGWLNTQRFNVLVPFDAFQAALRIYDRLPAKTAGVGLPNLAAMPEGDALAGSLAEVVRAENPQARRYASYLLGNVMRANVENLKTFERAITKECMAYSGRTARRVRREVYERWYIGKSARERRLAAVEARINELTHEIDAIHREKEELDERADRETRVLHTLPKIAELADAVELARRYETALAELDARIAEVDTSSFEDLKRQIAALTESIAQVDKTISELSRRMGELGERVRSLRTQIEERRAEAHVRGEAYDRFVADHPDDEDDLAEYYRARVVAERQAGTFSYDGFFRRYESAYQGLVTRRDRARTALRQEKQRYNHDFATLLEIESDDAKEYRDLLRRYRETELPEYRERISRARAEAERQFREHFVARLNEHLIDAEESFKEINQILRTITFGRDQYHFTLSKRPERRALFSAIETAAQVREVEGTLFDVLHGEDERAAINRLFDQILTHETDDPEIRDLCDYRQYFTYDIRIRHLDQFDRTSGKPIESYLSKVLREKSGGETQTPYYVAIAASFFRFYRDAPHAIRLVLFDEAFNKMDDQRIGQMIAFFRKLSIQVITAVPTEKLESIAPFMDRTNLVLRRDYRAFVHGYEVEGLDEEFPVEEATVPAEQSGTRERAGAVGPAAPTTTTWTNPSLIEEEDDPETQVSDGS